jgi:LacI family transcriptional regulator
MPKSPARRPRAAPARTVALLVETSNRYTRELLRGVRDYARDAGGWVVHLSEQGRGDGPPPWLKTWTGHGIIARIENAETAAAVRSKKLPVVNVSASGLAEQYPTVISDSVGVARLAAEHLLERGFRHFGYCGDGRFAWSAKHGLNFAAHLKRAGRECSFYSSTPNDFGDRDGERAKLSAWLAALPKPVGVMTCYDIRGQQVLDACRALRLRVPEEVAVIGQHNDDLLCELCDPPLSSVIPDARRAGYEAARLLARLMAGQSVAPGVHPIAPIGVAVRRSSDVIAVEDPRVAVAVRFLNEHFLETIQVDALARLAGLSRTRLERQFRTLLGRSPYDYALQLRLRRARELLAGSDLLISEVGLRAGFSTPEYFSAVFKKHTGKSPKGFRRREVSKAGRGATPPLTHR